MYLICDLAHLPLTLQKLGWTCCFDRIFIESSYYYIVLPLLHLQPPRIIEVKKRFRVKSDVSVLILYFFWGVRFLSWPSVVTRIPHTLCSTFSQTPFLTPGPQLKMSISQTCSPTCLWRRLCFLQVKGKWCVLSCWVFKTETSWSWMMLNSKQGSLKLM